MGTGPFRFSMGRGRVCAPPAPEELFNLKPLPGGTSISHCLRILGRVLQPGPAGRLPPPFSGLTWEWVIVFLDEA